nr:MULTISPECIES: hypothetical protein [unclassified Streptomyces]
MSRPRKSPPAEPGSAAAPAPTITAPTTSASRLASGKAVSAASTASRPLRDQRVKSAVMVPESANPATTIVTQAPNVRAPPAGAWPP